MSSLVFYRGCEIVLRYSQLPFCFLYTAFLLPSFSKALQLLNALVPTQSMQRAPPRPEVSPEVSSPQAGQDIIPSQNHALLAQASSPTGSTAGTLPRDWLQPSAQLIRHSWGCSKTPSLPRSASVCPQTKIYEGYPWMRLQEKTKSKRFCCNATSSTKTAKCSLHTWCSLKGHKQDTQTQTASSEAGPEEEKWIRANLTMVFHLTSADLSVEIKYETVVASIVCILGVALN